MAGPPKWWMKPSDALRQFPELAVTAVLDLSLLYALIRMVMWDMKLNGWGLLAVIGVMVLSQVLFRRGMKKLRAASKGKQWSKWRRQ